MKDLIFLKDNAQVARFRVDAIPAGSTGNLTVLETYLLDDRDPVALNTTDKVGLAEDFKKLPHTYKAFVDFAVDNNLTLVMADSTGKTPTIISGSFVVTSETLVSGNDDVAYTDTVDVNGGSGAYSFAITTGELPAGLTINPSTGVISGTPTAIGEETFTVTVTDIYFGFVATAELSINIAA